MLILQKKTTEKLNYQPNVTQGMPGKTQNGAHTLDYIANRCRAILSSCIMPPIKEHHNEK